ncbi:MAG: hypothetical protein FJX71_00280 [Alphaproteobacteria bacterium]|nr:hypothetical protein [Alphaproteobacteria bacterium]
MNKTLFSCLSIALVLSSFAQAMEKPDTSEPATTAPKVLKFKLNPDTGRFEDAEGSHLIQDYKSVIGDICEGLGALRDETREQIKKVELDLKKLTPDSPERLGAELYLKKLKRKEAKFESKSRDLVDLEETLQTILRAIHTGTSLSYPYVTLRVFNFELLGATSMGKHDAFMDLFSISRGLEDSSHVLLPIPYSLPDEARDILFNLQNIFPAHKLINQQREIFSISEMYAHVLGVEKALNHTSEMHLRLYEEIAKKSGIPVKLFLEKEMQYLIKKADEILIPQLAPPYYFFKVIEAFLEEAPRHKLTKDND